MEKVSQLVIVARALFKRLVKNGELDKCSHICIKYGKGWNYRLVDLKLSGNLSLYDWYTYESKPLGKRTTFVLRIRNVSEPHKSNWPRVDIPLTVGVSQIVFSKKLFDGLQVAFIIDEDIETHISFWMKDIPKTLIDLEKRGYIKLQS